MRNTLHLVLFAFLVTAVSSCEFRCNIGQTAGKEDDKNKPIVKNGSQVYNNIQLSISGVKVNRAYLAFQDGTRVPADNFIDFTQPVKMIVLIDSGWVARNDSVLLGASEKIATETGKVLLDEPDLFEGSGAITVTDSKVIALTAKILRDKDSPPASFIVSFRIWDKNGNGSIEGNYKLNSK
jgi:hypothetical protein